MYVLFFTRLKSSGSCLCFPSVSGAGATYINAHLPKFVACCLLGVPWLFISLRVVFGVECNAYAVMSDLVRE